MLPTSLGVTHVCAGAGPAGQPGLLAKFDWSVSKVVPDMREALPELAPGHYSSSFGIVSVEGLVVAVRV